MHYDRDINAYADLARDELHRVISRLEDAISGQATCAETIRDMSDDERLAVTWAATRDAMRVLVPLSEAVNQAMDADFEVEREALARAVKDIDWQRPMGVE